MEEFRMQYPLTPQSIVIDVGVYKGDFIADCRARWGCAVHGFEAMPVFAQEARVRFRGDSYVSIHSYGLSDRSGSVLMSLRDDSTSAFGIDEEHPTVTGHVMDVGAVFEYNTTLGATGADLMKINIEGGEFPLMGRMFELDSVKSIRFFQIQFHGQGADDPAAARTSIRERLALTHREEWCINDGQWESWARL